MPDDDAGRADLYELLLPVSLGVKSPARIMRNMIETWAPWMSKIEAEDLIALIERTPTILRKRTGKDLGKMIGLTHAERERLNIRTIQASDLTDEQRAEHREAKRRQQFRLSKQRQRRRAGKQTRAVWIAASRTKQKPWALKGISRASWYRQQKMRQPVRQVVPQINTSKSVD